MTLNQYVLQTIGGVIDEVTLAGDPDSFVEMDQAVIHVESCKFGTLPLLELRRIDNGGVIVVDENLMILASFMTQTPNLHLKGQGEGVTNFDAGLNMDAAKWFVAECQKRWASPSYAKFLNPPSP